MNISPLTASSAVDVKRVDEKSTDQAALGQDAFMRLLLAQLQNQDPTSPQADGEFLAQLAQFSQLEQLQEMNKKLDAIATVFSLVDPPTATTESSTTATSRTAATAPAAGSR